MNTSANRSVRRALERAGKAIRLASQSGIEACKAIEDMDPSDPQYDRVMGALALVHRAHADLVAAADGFGAVYAATRPAVEPFALLVDDREAAE